MLPGGVAIRRHPKVLVSTASTTLQCASCGTWRGNGHAAGMRSLTPVWREQGSVESTTVFLENVGGGGEHGGSVGVRTCDPDERTPCTVSYIGSIRSINNVSVLFSSPFVVVKTFRLRHFASVTSQFHATARASHPQIDCWPCFFKCRR